MKDTESFFKNKSRFKKIVGIFLLFILSYTLFYQGMHMTFKLEEKSNVRAFNEAVSYFEKENIELQKLIDEFSKVENSTKEGSVENTYSKYNLAYLIVNSPDLTIEQLRAARTLLTSALRVFPNDRDIVENLEIITYMLIEKVKNDLVASGLPEDEAKEKALQQELGELPVIGSRPSRGGGSEKDY